MPFCGTVPDHIYEPAPVKLVGRPHLSPSLPFPQDLLINNPYCRSLVHSMTRDRLGSVRVRAHKAQASSLFLAHKARRPGTKLNETERQLLARMGAAVVVTRLPGRPAALTAANDRPRPSFQGTSDSVAKRQSRRCRRWGLARLQAICTQRGVAMATDPTPGGASFTMPITFPKKVFFIKYFGLGLPCIKSEVIV